ncbi:MAG: alpha/beta hydrolase-fold protein [Verrucomicrobiota bacterium]
MTVDPKGAQAPVAFRTFEISDARFAHEHLHWVTVKSAALQGRADITLHLPPQIEGLVDVPVVILLHGVYGSHWAWALKGAAHRTAQQMIEAGELPPLVLAMPSDGLWGDGSGYLPHRGQDFERWIVDEVPAATARATPAVSGRSRVCIAGLSMGGFGALRLAGKFPERFAAAAAHSAITDFEQMKLFVEERLASYMALDEDRSVLRTLLANRHRLPPLRFDCGTSDLLIAENRALHAALEEQGVPHTYEEHPGGHEWPYWETHLRDTLRFFGERLWA